MPIFKRPHFKKLLELAEKDRIAPLYLFLGDLELGAALSARLFKHLKALGHLGEEFSSKEIKNQFQEKILGSPALFGRKVIYLKDASEIINACDKSFLARLEKNKQRLTLILVLESLKESHPLYEYAEKLAVLMPLPKTRERDLLHYEIPEILASFGKKMDRQAAELLLTLVGEDLNFITLELEKLSLYVGKRPVITVEDVREVVTPRPEEAPYLLMEILFREGPEAGLKVLKDLLSQNIHPLVVLATILTFLKRIYLLKEVFPEAQKIPRDYRSFQEHYRQAIKRTFADNPPKPLAKLHPYAAFKMLPILKKFDAGDFPLIFKALSQVDRALKTGSPPEEVFYKFFCELSPVAY
ncbi:DNA polymerase III subunit delta [Thermodesulfatator atlanticus]|uniref:DNA polymerase III subunit delta n=1 Tax=Thermodesulfatator atlanticus TaxID=501497 RepID=UPI0003B302E0|nr:DNA polymerase III subunit delta [Thermodesulfatator atlanticus]